LIEKINGKRDKQLKYYHKDTAILRKVYSPDNKWETGAVNTTYVAADFVAVNSELPIKDRATVAMANGKLPKIGIKKVMQESDINMLNVMEAQGGNAQQIAQKLANDAVACNVGIDELNEYAFLSGLSNGYVAIPNEDTPDNLLRINFNYLANHKFGIASAEGITLDDIENVFKSADENGDVITKIWVSKTKFDELKKTRGAKELVANYNGQSFTDATNLAVPTASKFKEAFADEYNGVEFEVVDRSVIFEKNGKKTSVKPFNPNTLVFVCSDQIGALVYGRLAEQTNPVDGVKYNTIDGYKLISEYSLVEPLREISAGQAFSAPIIEVADQLYMIDCTDVQVVATALEADDTTDQYITVWGSKYTKATFINALKSMGVSIKSNATDDTVIKAVNALDADAEETLKKLVETAKV
jgi:hypothetical protein